jgi:hypothetical protein
MFKWLTDYLDIFWYELFGSFEELVPQWRDKAGVFIIFGLQPKATVAV